MSKIPAVVATLALSVLAACESPPSKEDIGMATGAVLGGVIGHQVGHGTGQAVATIGGAALGGFLGGRVGRNMDRSDQVNTAQALDYAPDGQPMTWNNAASGQRYSVTPTHTYPGGSGRLCRDFTTVVRIDGRDEIVRGTACKQADGTWETL